MPPITPSSYVSQTTTALTINGFTLYLGTDNGAIYKKNLLSGAPETLTYSGGLNIIKDIELF
jgi:hypothetical protein